MPEVNLWPPQAHAQASPPAHTHTLIQIYHTHMGGKVSFGFRGHKFTGKRRPITTRENQG